MPAWLLIVIGLAVGISGIVIVLFIAFGRETDPRKRRGTVFAKPSGNPHEVAGVAPTDEIP